MRILVTGGTGFIGRRLVPKLAKDHKVYVLTRDESRARELFGEKSEPIVGDILDRESLAQLSRKRLDVVYHLAAELDETSPRLWETNVDGTRNLLEAIKGKKLERFVYLSSIGVLGETSEPAREDLPYNPGTKYEKSKAEAERMIMYYWLKYGLPYTILRSTIVYGPNRFWASIIKAAREGYPIIGEGKNYFHLVYVDDVVDALVAVLSPRARNKIYHVAGPDVLTYKETYQVIRELLGLDFMVRKVPKSLALALATVKGGIKRISGKKIDVTEIPASIKRLTRNRIVDTSLIERELGWKPKYTLRNGMKRTIRELKRRGLI